MIKHSLKNVPGIFKLKQAFVLAAVLTILSACSVFSGRQTTGEYIDDTTITTSVKTAILKEPLLKTFQIHVETFQNQVQLSGFVDSHKASQKAEQLARNVEGVKDVQNSLVIRKHAAKHKHVKK